MNHREFLRGSRPPSPLDCSRKFGVALKTNQMETKTNHFSTNQNQSLTQNHSLHNRASRPIMPDYLCLLCVFIGFLFLSYFYSNVTA